MEFKQAESLAKQLMDQHGLTLWSFQWSRGKRILGSCEERRQIIRLSAPYVKLNTASHVRDTILHEIAHALAGCKVGHGEKWKKMCRKIGATPKRLDRKAALPQAAYEIYCPSCNDILAPRHRRPKVGVMERMYCKGCGPKSIGTLDFRTSMP